jgi:hypothetical protein
MPSLPCDRQVGELVDPDERRTGDVLVEVRLASRLDTVERVPAVDEAELAQ